MITEKFDFITENVTIFLYQKNIFFVSHFIFDNRIHQLEFPIDNILLSII